MSVKIVMGTVLLSFLLSSCTFITGFVSKVTNPSQPEKMQRVATEKRERMRSYGEGFNACIQKRCKALYRKGIVRQWVGGRIVNGIYVPGHYEFVLKKIPVARSSGESILSDEADINSASTTQSSNNSAVLGEINKIVENRIKFARHYKRRGSAQEVATLIHKPKSIVQLVGGADVDSSILAKIDVNDEVDLFMKYMKNYQYTKAERVALIISRLDVSKIKKDKRFPFYMNLTRLMLVMHDYDGAYNAVLKAIKSATNDAQKESALQMAVTAAESWGDPGAMYESFIRLGDFYRQKGELLKAVKEYYLARKIENDPEVDTRIADVLKMMGQKDLSKAFNLDAYINGVVGVGRESMQQ